MLVHEVVLIKQKRYTQTGKGIDQRNQEKVTIFSVIGVKDE